jgi:hypothetical protein
MEFFGGFTFAPSFANYIAFSKPTPLLPLVIKVTFPLYPKSIFFYPLTTAMYGTALLREEARYG